tara:strand:- start:35 stop:232 length:198 start_codon:yes stop_codon:yes gene_type:complete
MRVNLNFTLELTEEEVETIRRYKNDDETVRDYVKSQINVFDTDFHNHIENLMNEFERMDGWDAQA